MGSRVHNNGNRFGQADSFGPGGDNQPTGNHHQPPVAAAVDGTALIELLAQVAPQARITENTSQLTTRASARILGKVSFLASSTGAPGDSGPAGKSSASTASL